MKAGRSVRLCTHLNSHWIFIESIFMCRIHHSTLNYRFVLFFCYLTHFAHCSRRFYCDIYLFLYINRTMELFSIGSSHLVQYTCHIHIDPQMADELFLSIYGILWLRCGSPRIFFFSNMHFEKVFELHGYNVVSNLTTLNSIEKYFLNL